MGSNLSTYCTYVSASLCRDKAETSVLLENICAFQAGKNQLSKLSTKIMRNHVTLNLNSVDTAQFGWKQQHVPDTGNAAAWYFWIKASSLNRVIASFYIPPRFITPISGRETFLAVGDLDFILPACLSVNFCFKMQWPRSTPSRCALFARHSLTRQILILSILSALLI